ncbi:hypothetical protein [Nostoc sp. 106C]|uniref:hypothetical protein n=1 Tax=Nostoc sp. 106C TaxID=1932667 RepID=UPI001412D8C6|nr:hypothetical protein [Nostoc sp. 106C]
MQTFGKQAKEIVLTQEEAIATASQAGASHNRLWQKPQYQIPSPANYYQELYRLSTN